VKYAKNPRGVTGNSVFQTGGERIGSAGHGIIDGPAERVKIMGTTKHDEAVLEPILASPELLR
jgi:hypothetical protein